MSLSIYYSSLAQKIWESFWKGAFLWWVIIICHSSKIQVLCWMKWPGKFFMTKFQHSSGIHLGEILKNFPGSFHLSINIFFLKSVHLIKNPKNYQRRKWFILQISSTSSHFSEHTYINMTLLSCQLYENFSHFNGNIFFDILKSFKNIYIK